MPVDEVIQAQVRLVLNNLHGSAVYPAPDQWNQIDDFDYLYREYAILAREQDADRVERAVIRILQEAGYGDVFEGQEREIRRERVSAGVVCLMVPETPMLVPAILDQLDEDLGPGVGTPDHIVYVCPYVCSNPEPIPVPRGTQPNPPPAGSTGQDVAGHDMTEQAMRARPEAAHEGEGVSVVVVDTGLIKDAAAGHPWLDGVRGADEYTYAKLDGRDRYTYAKLDGEDRYTYAELDGEEIITPYSSHGTFGAGVARCVAPRITVYVERAFAIVGADYETSLLHSLERALDREPHILAFPFTTSTRRDLPPLTFDDLFERRTRYLNGLVMLAAAGNDTAQRLMWPAAYREVISVGALSPSGRERAFFSNHGNWVDVYAPGQELINAFPVGTYVYTEPPKRGTSAYFEGMAMWGGTSFAVPIVAGLIAARMSATGQNARQAADSLLQAARDQGIPEVGAVLHPGQALLGYRRD